MAEIKTIHGGRIPGEPSAIVIETLERLLADARRGEVIGFAYAIVRPNGEQATGWDGEGGSRHTVASAIMMLNHRYATALLKKGD